MRDGGAAPRARARCARCECVRVGFVRFACVRFRIVSVLAVICPPPVDQSIRSVIA